MKPRFEALEPRISAAGDLYLPTVNDPVIHTTFPDTTPPIVVPVLVAPDKPLTGTPVPLLPIVAN